MPENDRLSRLRPIPAPVSPAGQLGQALRDLAGGNGFGTLRALAQAAHIAVGPTSQALSGRAELVPSKMVVDAICTACHADESTRDHLLGLRDTASKAPQPQPQPPDQPDDPPGEPVGTVNRTV